jgi:hypothetical protein
MPPSRRVQADNGVPNQGEENASEKEKDNASAMTKQLRR